MIPKIIHQIYWDFSGENKPPPKKWVEYSKVLKKNNQNWIYKLWDEKSCLNLLVNNYPWFLDTYNNYKYQLQKVDSMRPFLLYHFGGIYFDMDFKCVKNITNFFKKKGVYLAESSHFGLTNALMASSKNHPFWKKVFSEMVKNRQKKFYQIHHLYMMQSTGPLLITNCYNKYKTSDIYIIPKELFNPCNVCTKKCKITNEMYCYTSNSSSWHKLDSKIINFVYCNYKIIVLCIVIITCFSFINRE